MAYRTRINTTPGASSNKGFTLIELSIVLTIIGLLTGGILAAQSVISTVRSQALIRQIQQFEIGVANFQSRYGSLPGDSELFGGDGNGLIEDGSGSDDGAGQSVAMQYFSDEIANFWRHLQLSGFSGQGKDFSATVGGAGFNYGNNINTPKAELGKNAGIIAANCTSAGVFANCYTFANWDGLAAGFQIHNGSRTAFTPAEALAVDVKLDDGKPQTGAVQNRVAAFQSIDYGASNDCDTFDELGNHTNAAYSVENNRAVCYLAVSIGGQAMGAAYTP